MRCWLLSQFGCCFAKDRRKTHEFATFSKLVREIFDLLIPLAIGIALGGVIAFTLQLSGMAKEKSSATVTLVAIAAFYPVFAAKNGDLKSLILHTAIMAVFIACAWAGFLWSATIIAIGLIAHGLFDLLMLNFESPVPFYWPV